MQDIQGSKEIGIKTFKMLAEVLGVVLEVVKELELEYRIIPPIVWKATFKIAGKGRTTEKKMAQKYILDNYNIKCTEDEADAACIGMHFIKSQNSSFDWS